MLLSNTHGTGGRFTKPVRYRDRTLGAVEPLTISLHRRIAGVEQLCVRPLSVSGVNSFPKDWAFQPYSICHVSAVVTLTGTWQKAFPRWPCFY